MKKSNIFLIVLLLLPLFSWSQIININEEKKESPKIDTTGLPPCIMEIVKGDISGYRGKGILPNGIVTFTFSVTRPPKCMDCFSGTTVLYENCERLMQYGQGYATTLYFSPRVKEEWCQVPEFYKIGREKK